MPGGGWQDVLTRAGAARYSKGSRLASEIGGPIEKLWGSLMKSGDENMLRTTYQVRATPRGRQATTGHWIRSRNRRLPVFLCVCSLRSSCARC
jgi:hypothetical protein